jgi:hypothetical protein
MRVASAKVRPAMHLLGHASASTGGGSAPICTLTSVKICPCLASRAGIRPSSANKMHDSPIKAVPGPGQGQ